ncbi:hypothetical protein ACFZAU_41015 [Streptomyces sp. NPDC008238]
MRARNGKIEINVLVSAQRAQHVKIYYWLARYQGPEHPRDELVTSKYTCDLDLQANSQAWCLPQSLAVGPGDYDTASGPTFTSLDGVDSDAMHWDGKQLTPVDY